MANEKLSWIFELFDKMSGPSSKISASLAGMNLNINVSQTNITKLGREADSAGKKFLDFGTGLNSWLGIAKRVGGAALSIGEALGGWSMAGANWVIDTMSFKESMLASFRILEGSESAAKAIFNKAIDFAAVTPFSTREVVEAFKSLRGAGFTATETPIVFQGLSDIGAMSGNSGAMASIIYQLSQAKGRGKLGGEDWKTMQQHLGPAGVGQEPVFEKIAKNMGIAPNAVMKAMEAGQVTWKQGLFAILEAAEEKFGSLGAVAVAQGATIKGLFETLKSRPDEWIFKDDAVVNASEGLNIFRTALKNMNEVLRVGSDSGNRIQAVLFRIINTTSKGLFGRFAGADGLVNTESLVMAILDGVQQAFAVVRGIASFIEGFGTGLSPALKDLFAIQNSGDLLDPAKADQFARKMEEIGVSAGKFVASLMEVSTQLVKISSTLSQGPLGRFLGLGNGYEPKAPAEKFFEATLGGLFDSTPKQSAWVRQQAAGLSSEGIRIHPSGFDQTLAWARSTDASGGTGLMKSAFAAAGGAGQLPPIQISIDNRGNQGDADAIARKLDTSVPEALNAYFQKLATEGGG